MSFVDNADKVRQPWLHASLPLFFKLSAKVLIIDKLSLNESLSQY